MVIEDNRILLSIVMPVYNAGEYLEPAVHDLLSQTDLQFEFIIVDDGSQDGSRQILQELETKHRFLNVIYQDNMGGGIARNKGLKQASGDYVLFLDHDDRFEHTMVEELKRELKLLIPDILVFGADRFKNGMSKTFSMPNLLNKSVLSVESQRNRIISPYELQKVLFKFTHTTIWNKVFRRDFLIKNRIQFQSNPGNDTLAFSFLSLCCAEKVGYYENIFVHYREGSLNGQILSQDKWPTSIYKALLFCKEELEARDRFEIYKSVFIQYAVRKCMSRMEMLRSFEGQKKLYDLMHEYGIEKLGLTEEKLKEAGDVVYLVKIRCIAMYSYEEYLQKQLMLIKNTGLLCRTAYKLPKFDISEFSRVILYGCGNVGRSYYIQLLNQRQYKVVLWVGADNEALWFPVSSIEQIFATEFDYIVVAEEDVEVESTIRESLIRRGIDRDRILWKPPVII